MLPICAIPTCTTPVAKHNLCLGHLAQALDHRAQRANEQANARRCTADGCTKTRRANGLCTGHDTRRRRGQTLTPLAERPETCTEPACAKRHYSKGRCRSHYEAHRRALKQQAA